jgi:hypothetical protein
MLSARLIEQRISDRHLANGEGDVDREGDRPRYYIFRVIYAADPPLASAIPVPFDDLIAAWQEAGELRRQQPDAMFIVGEMCSMA